MNLDPARIRQEIANLKAICPEAWDEGDEQLLHNMLEAQTDLFEFLRVVEDRRADAESVIEAIDIRIKTMCDRQKRYEQREQSMRSLALKVMQAAGVRTVPLPEATLSVQQGREKVEILDASSCPDHLCRVKKEPDKSAIKEALQSGEQFNWAALVKGQDTLSVRTK